MTINELAEKLTECHNELMKLGACGGFVMDDRTVDNRKVISIQFSAEELAKVQADAIGCKPFYTAFSKGSVLKHILIGRADFYALIDKEEAQKEMFA